MKRTLLILMAGLLALAGFVAPATAKKSKKVKPVTTTLYFHGDSAVGEVDSFPVANDVNLKMDPTEPDGSDPKSKQIVNGVATPNAKCAGNNFFPLWIGDVAGKIKGDVKVTFGAVSSPGQVVIRVWPDVFGLMCDSNASGSTDYPEPAREMVVDVPPGPGTVEAVLEGKPFVATANVMVQISPLDIEVAAGESIFPPLFSRVLYDSTDYPSNIEFKCVPLSGKTCS